MDSLLEWDDIDFFIEFFTFYKFFKDFFIIDFPKDTAGIFVDEVECVIIEIKECLVEKCFLKLISIANAICG